MHRQRYAGDDPGDSLKVSGRYHRGGDRFAAEESWAALYLALSPDVCIGELVRHVTPELLAHLNAFRISELSVTLSAIADCRNAALMGLSAGTMIGDRDYRVSQRLGAAAVAAGIEGIIVPSATYLGDNLIVFTDHSLKGSTLAVVSSRDPRLFVDRP